MSRNGNPACLYHFPLNLAALAVLLWLPPLGFAQPKGHTPQIIEIAIQANDKGAPIKEVDLRPNTPTEFGFDLKNLAGEILGDVTLKVVQVVEGQSRVMAEAKIPKLDQTPENGKGFPVRTFEMMKKGVKLELAGLPPFKLQVHIQHKNSAVPITREFKLVVREPKDYVSPTANFDPTENLLRVDVEAKGAKSFLGPHLLPVKLVLSPDVTAKTGNLGGKLTDLDKKVTLDAGELSFLQKNNEGEVHLKVDDYERAFTYLVKGNTSGAINPHDASAIRVRIGVPRYSAPDKKFKVPLEVDGPLTEDYAVNVGLDQVGESKERKGLREQKATLSISPEGKLICQVDVRDWQFEFDTSEIRGRNVKFRVSVLKDGKKVELTAAPEFRPLKAKTVPDDRTKEIFSVFALVTVDDSEPEGIKLELPKDKVWAVGTPLELRAQVKERKATQAPIGRAILIRGKVPKDEKQEPEILAEGELDPKQNDWKFLLPPQSKPDTLQFSVQFMTVTGVKAALLDTLSFKAGTEGAKKLFTIKGRVLEGGRPQPDLDVLLLDAKGKEKAKAKTSPKGEYVFENLEPGSYAVMSTDDTKKRTATKKVDVPVKDNKEVVLNLFAK